MTNRFTLWLPVALVSATALAGCSGGSLPEMADARAVAPNNGASDYEVGKMHFAEARMGLAIKSFRQAMHDDPQSVRTLNALAASYDRIQRFDLAQTYYDRALAIEPQSAQTLNNIGYSMLLRGDRAEALAYFEKAKSIDPQNTVVAANLSRLAPDIAAAGPARPLRVASRPANPGDDRPRAWIERKNEKVQYLVTTPELSVIEQARRDDVAPNLIAYSPLRPAEPKPAATVDRSPTKAPAAGGRDDTADGPGVAPPTAFPKTLLRYLIALMGIDFGQPDAGQPMGDVAASATEKGPA